MQVRKTSSDKDLSINLQWITAFDSTSHIQKVRPAMRLMLEKSALGWALQPEKLICKIRHGTEKRNSRGIPECRKRRPLRCPAAGPCRTHPCQGCTAQPPSSWWRPHPSCRSSEARLASGRWACCGQSLAPFRHPSCTITSLFRCRLIWSFVGSINIYQVREKICIPNTNNDLLIKAWIPPCSPTGVLTSRPPEVGNCRLL